MFESLEMLMSFGIGAVVLAVILFIWISVAILQQAAGLAEIKDATFGRCLGALVINSLINTAISALLTPVLGMVLCFFVLPWSLMMVTEATFWKGIVAMFYSLMIAVLMCLAIAGVVVAFFALAA